MLGFTAVVELQLQVEPEALVTILMCSESNRNAPPRCDHWWLLYNAVRFLAA